jgi:t-SNARE complex subunit (syntaxin)
LKVMINRAASSIRTDFQRKINVEEIYYNVELCSFQTKFEKTVKDSMSAMKSVEHKVWSMIFLIAMLICFILILTVIFFAVF